MRDERLNTLKVLADRLRELTTKADMVAERLPEGDFSAEAMLEFMPYVHQLSELLKRQVVAGEANPLLTSNDGSEISASGVWQQIESASDVSLLAATATLKRKEETDRSVIEYATTVVRICEALRDGVEATAGWKIDGHTGQHH